MLKMIYATCMNEHSADGRSCRGTDLHAMRFLSVQLNEYAPLVNFPLETEFLCHEQVHLGKDSPVIPWVNDGGGAVMRIFVGVGHYALCTKITDTDVYLWDPYLEEMPKLPDVSYHLENKRDYNLIVSRSRFEQYGHEMFMLSDNEHRNVLLMRRKK